MAAIQKAVEWLEQNKGCGWDCLKCNYGLRLKFKKLDKEGRKVIVDAICSCDVKAFENCQPLLWLLALLGDNEYERFVGEWARQAPFGASYAWEIIKLSAGNQGAWRFNAQCGPPSFKPRFHLHPAIAPWLLSATVRAGAECGDA